MTTLIITFGFVALWLLGLWEIKPYEGKGYLLGALKSGKV